MASKTERHPKVYSQMVYNKCKHPISDNYGNVILLKSYEIPSYIEFVEELPRKAGTDKIDYALLETRAI